ncbi:Flp family type IVb pilin [Erythrobacter sp. SD-21]|uniref:Flp family type IVb pilin n=1 Tax=Erythrobacter sp. SD-21 TaxID=161528 RepID=UPI00031FC38A|nr:Flp family type IVb pilin [Erythrobacter sp. SD-21]
MTKMLTNFLRDESGASAAEYALILAIVGAGLAFAVFTVSDAIERVIYPASSQAISCDAGSDESACV